MKIREEIKQAHHHLSDCSVRFLEFAANHAGALKRSNFSPLKALDGIMTLQPWPTFIDQTRKKEFGGVSVDICRLIKSLPRRLFNNDRQEISRYFEIPVNAVDIQLDGVDDLHIEGLLARGDFIISGTALKCLEFNITANLGGWPVVVAESLYLNTPVIDQFLRENRIRIRRTELLSVFFHHVIDTVLKRFPGADSVNCAVVSDSRFGDDLRLVYKEALKKKDASLEGELIFCGFEHMEVSGDRLFFKGKHIRAVHELYHGLVTPQVNKIFKAGKICLFNGTVTSLMSNKLNIALLSENQHSDLFNAKERALIQSHIPWTRKMVPGDVQYKGETGDLESAVRDRRESLVLKISDSVGGANVYIGKHTTQTKWNETVTNAFAKRNWLVQEYVEPTPYLYQWGENGCAEHNAIWGFFVCGSRYAGLCVRVLPLENKTGIVNQAQGAVTSVAFEVDG
jgi:hypothetical protein